MKLMLTGLPAVLAMTAENAADLRVIGDLVNFGPLQKAQLVKVPEGELPFERSKNDGMTTLIGGAAVVIGVKLNLEWLTYAEPLSAARQLRTNTAARLGHSLLDAFELLSSDKN